MNVQVKVNGVPNVVLDDRYLGSFKRVEAITEFGNVLVNVFVREDNEGLVDRYALLHLDAENVFANPSESKSSLLAALDWTVKRMASR